MNSESRRMDAASGGPPVRFEELKKKRPQKNGADADRLPPHSPEAEQGALGCILLAPLDCLNVCEERGMKAAWYYDGRNGAIYEALSQLHQEGKGIDTITLMERLKKMDLLEQCGGVAYLSTLPDLVPSAANLTFYLDILEDKWLLRSLTRSCIDIENRVHESEAAPRELLAEVTGNLLKLQEEGLQSKEQVLKLILREVVQELEDYHRGHAQIRGVASGLEYFDKLAGGCGGRNGFYWVFGARPGVGKTSFAMQWAEHAALEYVWWDPVLEPDGKTGKLVPIIDVVEEGGERKEKIRVERKVGVPVGIMSLEMTATALAMRSAFSRARGDLQRWRTGFATTADLMPLTTAVGQLAKAKIYIDDTGRCTLETLRAKMRRMARQHGIKLFIIDYLQLLRLGSKQRRVDRVEELSEISGELFALGKELQVPIITLAQLNREVEKEPNREPRLSDLKDCGAIEQDADFVGFLYRPKLKEKDKERWDDVRERVYGDDWSKAPTRVNLLAAKYRHGPSGKNAQLLFEGSSTRFFDYYVWLKEHGEHTPALGEQSLYQRGKIDPEDVPGH